MGHLERASKEVDMALKMNPEFREANKLYQRIHGKPWVPVKGKVVRPRPIAEGAKESAKDLDP